MIQHLARLKSANTTALSRFGQIQTCSFKNSQQKIQTSKQSDPRLSGKLIKCPTNYLYYEGCAVQNWTDSVFTLQTHVT